MKKGDFEKYLVVNEFQEVKCLSAKEAFNEWKRLFSAPDCDVCRILCNGIDLTDNVVAMGSKRGW